MTFRDGARAVVTGAASGMGEATVRRLGSEGVEVLAVDVNEAGMARHDCETMVADLGDPGDRARVAERASGFDYLVNSAAIIQFKSIFDFTVDDWRRVFQVNAESTFFLCQTIGPTMRPGGAIVNFSSTSAKLSSTIEAAPYAATKTAILSITRSFAYALAHLPIRVYEKGKGKSTYAYTGGGPNAAMLGSDGFVYNTQCPMVGAWVAPDSRPPSIQRASPDGKVEIVATEADGVPLTAPNDLCFGPDGRLYFTDSGDWDPVGKPHRGLICVIDTGGS